MAVPTSGFSLQDVIDEIQKYGKVLATQSLSACFQEAEEVGFVLSGRDSLADFGGYTEPAPLTPSLTIPSTVNLNADGDPVPVLLESNTTWAFSSIASWITIVPSSGNGNAGLAVSAQAVPVGTTSGRSDVVTATTSYINGGNVSANMTISQPANPAYIEITTPSQDPLPIAFNASPITFGLSTNATYSISSPSWITISNKTSSSFQASFNVNNSTTSTREGDIVVTTTTAGTNVNDSVTIQQAVAPAEQITTTPATITNVSYSGQGGNEIQVTTTPYYSTTWAVAVINYSGFDPVSISSISPSSGTGDGSFTFYIGPNNDYTLKRSFVRVYKSNQNPYTATVYDDTLIEQVAAPNLFTYNDAGVSGFSVNRNTGAVTAPTASAGTITNLSYSSGYSGGYYPLVASDTLRSVNVTVQVPSGYDNSGQTVSGTESTYQQFLPETISISTASTAVDPQGDGITVYVDTADELYSTSWTAYITYTDQSNSTGWVYLAGGSTGTGDGSFYVGVDPNYSGSNGYDGTTRYFDIRVDKNGGGLSSNTLSFYQTVGSPPVQAPTFSVSPSSLDFDYSQSGSGAYQTITATYTGGSIPTAVSFYLSGTDFGLVQTDSNVPLVVSGGPWVAEATNDGAGSFQVGVYPLSTNYGGSNNTESLSINMGNSGGTTSDSVPLTQTYYVAPPPTYYIFESCDDGSLVMTDNVTPSTSQRAYDSSVNYYVYTNTTTTNASLHTIKSLTLQSATGCPPVYISRIVEKNDGTANGYIPLSQSYPQDSEVVILGYGSSYTDCWTVGVQSTISPNLTVDGPCPAAPPPPPPPPPPPTATSWDCITNVCTERQDNLGFYATLKDCRLDGCENLQ